MFFCVLLILQNRMPYNEIVSAVWFQIACIKCIERIGMYCTPFLTHCKITVNQSADAFKKTSNKVSTKVMKCGWTWTEIREIKRRWKICAGKNWRKQLIRDYFHRNCLTHAHRCIDNNFMHFTSGFTGTSMTRFLATHALQ